MKIFARFLIPAFILLYLPILPLAAQTLESSNKLRIWLSIGSAYDRYRVRFTVHDAGEAYNGNPALYVDWDYNDQVNRSKGRLSLLNLRLMVSTGIGKMKLLSGLEFTGMDNISEDTYYRVEDNSAYSTATCLKVSFCYRYNRPLAGFALARLLPLNERDGLYIGPGVTMLYTGLCRYYDTSCSYISPGYDRRVQLQPHHSARCFVRTMLVYRRFCAEADLGGITSFSLGYIFHLNK